MKVDPPVAGFSRRVRAPLLVTLSDTQDTEPADEVPVPVSLSPAKQSNAWYSMSWTGEPLVLVSVVTVWTVLPPVAYVSVWLTVIGDPAADAAVVVTNGSLELPEPVVLWLVAVHPL